MKKKMTKENYMAINTKLLNTICTTPGAPGFEQKVRDLVLKEIKPLVDEIEIDNMGNVYAIKRGTGDKRVMVGAHMDEIGFMVTHIDDKGFIRFHTLGGFDPKTLTAPFDIFDAGSFIIQSNPKTEQTAMIPNSNLVNGFLVSVSSASDFALLSAVGFNPISPKIF